MALTNSFFVFFKVKFSLSPKWKGRVIPGGRPKNVLRVLQSDASNSKILVGAGSPRLPAFGKGKKVCSAKVSGIIYILQCVMS